MMQYVAFLRGINFWGNKKIGMKELKKVFESLWFLDVSTSMNSGNVIFLSGSTHENIEKMIEKSIRENFQFEVQVLVISIYKLEKIYQAIPDSWKNKTGMLPHIAFVWEELDNSNIAEFIGSLPEETPVKYVPGALLWNVELKNWSKDIIYRYINAKASKQVTIRSINTITKLTQRIKNN